MNARTKRKKIPAKEIQQRVAKRHATLRKKAKLKPTNRERIDNLTIANSILTSANWRLQEEIRMLEKRPSEDAPFEWLSAEGVSMRPEDFENGHLRNAISFIARRLPALIASERFLNPQLKTFRPRPNVRYYARALYELLREAERRKIEV